MLKQILFFHWDLTFVFLKQKQPILFKYLPNEDGDTLNDAEPDEAFLLGFSTLNFTV